MKIVQIGPYPISPNCIRGGVESSVFGLVQELIRHGHLVHVFDIPRLNGVEDVDNIETLYIHRYINFGNHNKDAVQRVPVTVDDIIATQPQAIHIHGTGLFAAEIYYELCQRGYQPLVTIHGLSCVEKMNALRKTADGVRCRVYSIQAWKTLAKAIYQYRSQNRVECQLLESVPKAIVDTKYLVDALKKYPVNRLPELHVIPQGADEKFYGVERIAFSDEQRILCVGTFSQRKSQIELIRAFESVRAKGVKAKLVLCGVVSEQAYYKKVCVAIAQSPYKADIELHENLSQKDLLKEYSKATIFALHSQEESQGIVLAEAMAVGLPVVSTKVGGIPYVVEHGKTGLLTEYGDMDDTAQMLEKLLTDDVLYKQYSQNAKNSAEKYKWSNIANKILKLYQES